MGYIPRDEKADWGWRCTQDGSGTLRMGKNGRSIGIMLEQPIVNAIKTTLPLIRGERKGAFWIKDKNTIVAVDVEGDYFVYKEASIGTSQYSEVYRQRKLY